MPPKKDRVLRLNQKLSFKKVAPMKLSSIWDLYSPPEHWKTNLITLIHHHLPEEVTSTAELDSQLNKHLTDYRLQDELKITLQRIYALLATEVHDSACYYDPNKDGPMLARKLKEGIMECSEGFHNRVNQIWMFFFIEDNFTERLARIRANIVHQVAINLFDEVHAQNSVSIIASENHFGTQAIRREDKYSGDIQSRESIKIVLHEAFEQRYTPLLILKGIEEQIYSLLAHLGGYIGCKPDGLCYVIDNFGPYREIFKKVFSLESEAETQPFLLLNECSAVIDVNWPLIRERIFKKLILEGFFEASSEMGLKDIPVDEDNLDELAYWILCIASPAMFVQFLEKYRVKTKQINLLYQLHHVIPDTHPFKPIILSTGLSEKSELYQCLGLLGIFFYLFC